jgi:hypothetical protein
MESYCEFGIEIPGSIISSETIECPNNWGLSSSVRLHRVGRSVGRSVSSNYFNKIINNFKLSERRQS